jgi:DegV family protein with EDD domain
VVSGSKRKARIHVHVDDPEIVFRIAEQFGAVGSQKADDMRMQQSAAHHRRTQRVAVVTDSGADIPEEFVERLGIHVVPVRIHFANHSYLDKVSMTPAEFYRELVRNPEHPKTSQPPPGDFRRMFEFLASHYDAVVSVNLTSRHSGTWDAANRAAQRVGNEGKPVTALDSRNASVGQGLVAIAAAEAAAAGKDASAVAAAAHATLARTQTFALLGSIDFAVRGGRVPAIVGKLARLLGLGVILRTSPDGRISAGGGLFGTHRLRSRFARFVARRTRFEADREVLRILVGHGDRPEEGQRLADELAAALPADSVEFCAVTDMGPAIGVHGGPGTLVVAIHRKLRD